MLSPKAQILKGGTSSDGSKSPAPEGGDTAATRRASPPQPLGALLHQLRICISESSPSCTLIVSRPAAPCPSTTIDLFFRCQQQPMAHCEIRKPAASQFLRIFFRCQQQANFFSSRLSSSLPSPHRIGSEHL